MLRFGDHKELQMGEKCGDFNKIKTRNSECIYNVNYILEIQYNLSSK